MTDPIAQIRTVLEAAFTSQYKDDYQQGKAKLAEEIAEILDAMPADPVIEADSDFPERPQHLDFGRMSAAAEVIDSFDVNSGLTPPEEIGVDGDSFKYMAINRVGVGLEALGPLALLIDPVSAMAAAWGDGFAVGKEYQLRGGSRPAETGNAGDKEGSE